MTTLIKTLDQTDNLNIIEIYIQIQTNQIQKHNYITHKQVIQ